MRREKLGKAERKRVQEGLTEGYPGRTATMVTQQGTRETEEKEAEQVIKVEQVCVGGWSRWARQVWV